MVAATLALGATDLRAQLVYVDGVDDFTPASRNLFCADGAAMSACLINSSAATGNSRWGWIEAGAAGPGGTSVYESNTENSPELRMQVAAPDGTYDAYAVFWVDVNVVFDIRAGLTSNPGNNTRFGRTTANGATVGTFAANAIWATPPGDGTNATTDDDDNDATNFLNPLLGDNPYLDHTPGGGGGLLMYLAPLGQVTATGGSFNVFIDDGPSLINSQRSRFDGVAYVAAGADVTLEATIDRGTGNLTINNTTGGALNIARYALSSPAGGLDPAQWDSITDGGNASITESDAWSVTTYTVGENMIPANGAIINGNWLLAENESGGANGAQLAATTGAFNLGDVWVKTPFQDVLVSLELVGGAKVQLMPTYTGDAAMNGDFDGDDNVDLDDFLTVMGQINVPFAAGLTTVQRYRLGDINNSGAVNRDDFLSFRSAYMIANPGAGAAGFAAMVAAAAAIPEPSAATLAALAGGLLWARRRRRTVGFTESKNLGTTTMRVNGTKWVARARMLVAAAVVGGWLATTAQAVPVTGWACDPLAGGNCDALVITDADTDSPTFGDITLTNNANGIGVWGSTPAPVNLAIGEEVVMSYDARMITNGMITGMAGPAIANREWRYGVWRNVGSSEFATSGWLGYMALNSSGGTGRLEARNPDDPGFNTGSFLSDFGGGSIAATSGPAPAPPLSPVLPFGDPNLAPGTGTGRYFLLAEGGNVGNQGMASEVLYHFEVRIGRYETEEVTVSASIVGTDLMSTYTYNIGGGNDFDGNPPPALDAMGNPVLITPHVTYNFDRVGMLFGGATGADLVEVFDVDISSNAIQTLELNVDTTSGEAVLRNDLPDPFEIVYYEISSTSDSLRESEWTSVAEAGPGAATGDYNENGIADAADYTTWRDHLGQSMTLPNTDPSDTDGVVTMDEYDSWKANFGATGGAPDAVWYEAASSDDGYLFEGSPAGSETLNQTDEISLGNIFKTVANGGVQGTEDLRFFLGIRQGDSEFTIRGLVNYAPGGAGALAVPEPATCWLLLVGSLAAHLRGRRPPWVTTR